MTTTTAHPNSTDELPPSNDDNTAPSPLHENQEEEHCPSVTIVESRLKKLRMWRKPWIASLVLFFFFFFLWAPSAVIDRYWVGQKWEFALPGLNTSTLRKHTMRMHLTLGAFAVLISPIQIITPFTSGWKRSRNNWRRTLHRYSGRIYTICAIFSYILGQWFIILKKMLLVGGYNMGIAFSFAGLTIAYFAYMTWKTAPKRNTRSSEYTIQDHRNYAIRSFSQMIAPILYRYWYLLLMIYKLYRTPYLNSGHPSGEELVCDDRDVCDDYKRPFDAIFCWLYWMSSWAVAEVVIVCLPDHQERKVGVIDGTLGEGESTALLLEDQQSTKGDESKLKNDDEIRKIDRLKILVLNFVGCLLVVLTIMVSGGIASLIFMKRVGMKEKTTSSAAIDDL